MGRLIEVDVDELKELLNDIEIELTNNMISVVRENYIPKADYENCLKADVVAMLTELQLEIEELKNEPACCQHFVRGIHRSSEVIQQKIKALEKK